MASGAPRLTPLPREEWDEFLVAILSAVGGLERPLNVFTTLARHPDLFRPWVSFGSQLLLAGTLPARHRELAILRTAHARGCSYEWQHHVIIGREAGLADTEIDAAAEPLDGHPWAQDDRELLGAVDELLTSGTLTDPTWQALAARYDERQLIELPLLVGQYQMLALALNSLRVELEEPPPDGPPEEPSPPL